MRGTIFTMVGLGLLSTALFAAESETYSTNNIGRLLRALRKSPASMTMHWTAESTKDKRHHVNGIDNTLEALINYKLSDNDDLRIYSGTSVIIVKEKTRPTSIRENEMEFRYRRKNILTEDKHGIGMNAQIRYSMFPATTVRANNDMNGYFQGRLEFSKNFNSIFSLTTQYRQYQYLRKSKANTTLKRRQRIVIYPAFSITDKLTFTPIFYYNQYYYGGNRGKKGSEKYNTIQALPTLSYAFGRDFSLDLYSYFTPIVSGDNKMLAKDYGDTAAYGMIMNYKAF